MNESTKSAFATPEDLAALARAEAASAEAAANPRPPILTGPKRQHFLPRFYLGGFTRDGMLAVFDRDKNEIRIQQPTNTGVIGHYYTMEDAEGRRRFEVEALLSEYEGKAKPVVAKLSAGATDLSADERSDLAIFMAFAATRTPEMVNSMQALNSQMITRFTKRLFNNEEDVYQELRRKQRCAEESDEELRNQAKWMVQVAQSDAFVVETKEKWAVGMAIQTALNIAPYLAGRDWQVRHRENDKMSFITTDSPVLLGSVTPRGPSVYGVGFGSPDAFISCPLDQSCTLEMFGDSGVLVHRSAGRDYIRMANLALGKRCQRFLVGRDEALVRSVAEKLGLAGEKWRSKFITGGRA